MWDETKLKEQKNKSKITNEYIQVSPISKTIGQPIQSKVKNSKKIEKQSNDKEIIKSKSVSGSRRESRCKDTSQDKRNSKKQHLNSNSNLKVDQNLNLRILKNVTDSIPTKDMNQIAGMNQKQNWSSKVNKKNKK